MTPAPRRHFGLILLVCAAALASGAFAEPQDRAPAPAFTTAAERLASWARHQRLREESPFRPMRWQSIGPRFQGGRVETIDAVPGTGIIYAGFGAGSVWKTENEGLTWTPVFADQPTFTIGDLAIAPSNPDVVYVGTGESLMARSSFAGLGVFKSTDGARTWTACGLEETHHIGRVVVHPTDPDIVYVAALGHNFTDNEDRGLYKTTDGGRTWRKVLYVSPKAGIADVAMDPTDPRILYASANQHERRAWNNSESGEGSGVYKSVDGGETWTRLANGLPEGPHIGRIGLGVAPSDPRIVYAFLANDTPREEKTEKGEVRTTRVGPEIYRSDDQGDTWRKLPMASDRFRMGFYWDIIVAPDDPDIFYALGQNLMFSEDGGATFVNLHGTVTHLLSHPSRSLHLDQHDLWIDPTDPRRLILGNDGGLYLSKDRGTTWLHLNNIPAGEFYAVSVDDAEPYFAYGGTQDNAALFGPPGTLPEDGLDDPWRYVWIDLWGGGDSYVTEVDRSDPDTIYFEQQFGDFQRKDMRTGRVKRIRPPAGQDEPPLRFNWMSPFILSRHNPYIVYFGANRLFKSLNRGDDWLPISPDLTTRPGPGKQGNVPYGTITTIGESPLRPGLLYAGTDDGRLWVTRNDGAAWSDIARGLPDKWVNRVVASAHDLGTVYVTLTGYREDDFRAYAYKSTDFGATWTPIVSNLPSEQVNVIREDPESPDRLYLGTDQGGVYASFDRGASWVSLRADLPTAAVHDIAIQPREREMIVATHGLSMFKLDLAPVQAFTPEIAAADAHLFPVRPILFPKRRDYGNDWAFETMKPAVFHVYLKEAGPVSITIADDKGQSVWSRRIDGAHGVNRIEWKLAPAPDPAAAEPILLPGIRLVAPGAYTVEIAAGPAVMKTQIRVAAPDPPTMGSPRAR